MNLTAQQSLENIRQKRNKWVEANQENGFQQGIERLLSDLYPDQAHFVYELLQNAEDARATEIHFHLEAKKLTVTHNGARTFSDKDVESITSIGNSTKRDDVNQIGKFGVGFKAVFAYTKTPQVFSGEYSFRIHDLVVPEWVSNHAATAGETRFEFPFDNQKSAEQCFEEIAKWLNGMPDTVLLFLRQVSKISWEIEGQGKGQVYRENLKGTQIIEISQQATGDETEYATQWLRFEKPLPDKPSLFVSIAYSLEQLADSYQKFDVSKPIAEQLKVTALDGQLFIYFPADKETTDLKFHLHAPFSSTVARDSIPHTKENAELLSLIAELVAESLEEIKKLNLLTIDFLEVLPNSGDSLNSFYRPLFQACLDAMGEKALVPLHGGGHAPADNLLSGPASIRNVIDNKLLPFFVGEKLRWVAGVPQKNSRPDRFLRSLGINEWSWSQLIVSVDEEFNHSKSKFTLEESLNWLQQRSDEWMQAFYALLNEALNQNLTYEERNQIAGDLRKRHLYGSELLELAKAWQVIRASENLHLIGSDVYLPKEGRLFHENITLLKMEILKGRKSARLDNAEQFIKIAGVREVDEGAEIKTTLNRFYSEKDVQIDWQTHLTHLERFTTYWQENGPTYFGSNPTTRLFKDYSIFRSRRGNRLKPQEAFIDSPIMETGISSIYEDDVILSPNYDKICGVLEFAKSTGVKDCLEIILTSTWDNPDKSKLGKGSGNETAFKDEKDYTIENVEDLLLKKQLPISRLIWRTLSNASSENLQARYRPNKSTSYKYADSQLIHFLRKYSWIPTASGNFKKPSEICREELIEGFIYDDRNGWLTAIEFEANIQAEREKSNEQSRAKQQAAQALGLNEELVTELADIAPEEQEELLQALKEKKRRKKAEESKLKDLVEGKSISPRQNFDDAFNRNGKVSPLIDQAQESSPVNNPERYKEKISEELGQRRQDEPKRQERTKSRIVNILEPKNQEVRDFFIAEYNGHCQICEQTFPRKSDGKPYFQAVYIIPHATAAWTGMSGNVLCLCAQCSAKFQHGAVGWKNNATPSEQLLALVPESDSGVKPVLTMRLIGDETVIKFSDRHLLQIQALFQTEVVTVK